MKMKRILFSLLILLCLLQAPDVLAAGQWKTVSGTRRYYTSKTVYVKNSWYKIKNHWFYFNKKGAVKTGRFKVNGKYYYCKKSTGRVTKKRIGSYYYGSDGAMVKSRWVKIRKYDFYFGSNGKIKTGKFTVNGKTYYCKKTTGRVTKKRVGKNYYNSKGEMVKNTWVKNFYYDKKGNICIGKFTAADGKTYYCDKETGKVTSRWVDKHYYGEDGAMATSVWIGDSYVDATGTITKGNKNPMNPPTEKEIRLLAALVYYEAGNQSLYGKKCVASVVVNRMNSKRFPSTLHGVIYQSGQFTPAMNGQVTALYKSKKTIQKQCVEAATYVLTNGSVLKGYYYFNPYSGTLKIGDHYFS